MDKVLSERVLEGEREPNADRATIIGTIQGIAFWGILALGILVPPVSVLLNILK